MKYSKTDLGQQAFKERSPLISPRQRSAFIMFDGIKTVEKVLAATHGLGVTQMDVDYLVAHGFLVEMPVAPEIHSEPKVDVDFDISFNEAEALVKATKQTRYAKAKPVATQLTATLGLRGFRLNLAVEAASGYDELVNLFPKIQDALGTKACTELEQILRG